MSLSAISLVLAAGAIHASWNLISKKAGGGTDFVMLFSALGCIIYGPIALYLWLSRQAHVEPAAWLWVALSGVLHFFYALALQRGYQVGDLSVVYPIARGSGPVLATVGAVAILGESVSWLSFLGLVLIVGGIFIVSGFRAHTGIVTGIEYGLATGICIALYTLVDASVVRRVALIPLLLDYGSNVTRTALLAPAMIHRRRALLKSFRVNGKEAIAVATLMPLSYILILYAMRLAPVTHIAPAREVSMLFAVLAGATFLGEPHPGRRMMGAGLIAAGVIFISVSRF